MKKLSKKLLSVVTAAAMIFTVLATPIGEILGFTGEAVKASAATVTESDILKRIDEVKALFPNGSYFTTTGTKSCNTNIVYGDGYSYCYSTSCPTCRLGNVLEQNEKAASTNVASICKHKGRYSCYGFATFVFCYLFQHDTEENKYNISSSSYGGINSEFLSALKPGDMLTFNGGEHYAIYLNHDSNYIYLYESNYDSPNKVYYNHKRKLDGLKWNRATAIRSYTYDTGTDTDEAVSDYYRLTAPDGYQVIRSSYSTSASEAGRITVGDDTYVLVTKYSPDRLWGYVTYNGVSGWIRLYYVEKHDTHAYTSSVTKAATCTADGIKTFSCVCGNSYTEAIAKLAHSYTSSITTQPTCTATGIRTYKCSRCTSSYTETIAKTSHTYSSSYTIDKAATCSAEGSKSRHCTTSGCTAKTDVTVIPKTSHSYTSSITTQPTCTTTGIRTYKCSGCSASYTETIAKIAHSYTSSITTQPTCIATGVRTYKCSCGDSYTETIAKTSHTYSSSYTVDKAATCSAEGSKSRHCTTSGCTAKTDVTAIPMTSHDYASTVVAPTYNEQGYTLHKCVNCGDSYKDTYTDIKKLPAVKGFTSPSRSTSAIRLNWTKNANADGYVIEQFNGSAWVQIADVTDNSTTTYKVTGLKSGTAYKFRMKAYVNGTNGVVYGTKTATLTANTQASSVSGLALKSRSASALRLKWTKNTAVDGYIIEQKIDGEWTEIAVIEDYKTTEYKVTGLNASAKYSFRMKAYAITKYGDKTYSGYTSTLSKTTSPANVTGLKIGGRAGTALRLNWNKNTSADGYIIEQYKGGKWTQIADITDNATTTYRIDGLSPATQYKFRVRAYNMVGTTALYSNYTATLAAYTNPSAVSGLKIAGKAGTALRLGWTQNTTADGYIIEQYIDGKWTRIARIAGNETLSYRVENLTKATTYKFRVATYNIEDNVAYYGAYVTISGTTL